jgi:hypothetical protein
MPDYKNGKIYKLWSPEGDEIYIGSTINSLAKRLGQHKGNQDCNSKYLFEKYTDIRIELMEEYPCDNKMELNKKEGEYIRNNECLNRCIAGRTDKEYREANREKILKHYEANKEKILEQQKEYREANREKILERKKEYCKANKEKKQEYDKKYREANKEKILEYKKEKIVCECGCQIRRDCLLRHRRSNNHKELIKQMLSQPMETLEDPPLD